MYKDRLTAIIRKAYEAGCHGWIDLAEDFALNLTEKTVGELESVKREVVKTACPGKDDSLNPLLTDKPLPPGYPQQDDDLVYYRPLGAGDAVPAPIISPQSIPSGRYSRPRVHNSVDLYESYSRADRSTAAEGSGTDPTTSGDITAASNAPSDEMIDVGSLVSMGFNASDPILHCNYHASESQGILDHSSDPFTVSQPQQITEPASDGEVVSGSDPIAERWGDVSADEDKAVTPRRRRRRLTREFDWYTDSAGTSPTDRGYDVTFQ